ncbi:MAG: 4-(cytidine 5'-diphospho)-2-C-methyl-D-erythritol kinase [Cyclobacteriaceae bacterium]|nr:4-(cytidine 5'-diphospho)-2-C-methyl-D-erythritol kinase [Cyclobacteriaceae bacterium]
MIAFPVCKINLGLSIISKREDGYHNLETCFYPVQWCDILEVIPADQTSFSTSGIAISGDEKSNLCLRAYHLLKQDFRLPEVKIHLHKIIPMGAGLGGGSSDGAKTLQLLNDIFQISLSIDQLLRYAAQLGSDCSFFLYDRPMIGSGKGEILSETSISIKDYFLVLVKPTVHVSTQLAYANVIPQAPVMPLADVLCLPIDQWKTHLKNDFEDSVFKAQPVIREVKEQLYLQGAVYASMSGSGSSVFGIFEKPKHLKNSFIGMDYWEGILR